MRNLSLVSVLPAADDRHLSSVWRGRDRGETRPTTLTSRER